MDLTKAMELFEELKRRIDEDDDYLGESEYRTRILLIDPLLRMLGWNVEDRIMWRLSIRTGESVKERADYVLKYGESKVAIVEAKIRSLYGLPYDVKPKSTRTMLACLNAYLLMVQNGCYDLNQGRNPDTMQPWVEFDIKNNPPEQVLRCLLYGAKLHY